MPARHLDRLSALDASFLHQEGRESPMHIGAVAIFGGPPPPRERLLAHIDARLHLVPRYRQRLAHTPLDRGRPVWIDDERFRLEFHVRHVALPSPGRRDQLLALLSRTFSTPLERRRPLWELWLVEGLEDGGFALIFKTHHAVTDGVAGARLAGVFFDPVAEPAQPGELTRAPAAWAPARTPGTPALLTLAAFRDARDSVRLLTRTLAAAAHPQRAARHIAAALEGLGEIAWAVLNPAPETPLNGRSGPHRRLATASCALEDIKTIKNTFGGTVNDVVLAIVTGVLRRFLEARGVRTEGLELRALVPVSLRGAGEREGGAPTGNRVAAVRTTLPVHIADPLARLAAVRAAMSAVKESRQALGTQVLAGAHHLAPPSILAQATRLAFSGRLFNLLVTNVPGPPVPLFLLGRAMREVYPVPVLPPDHALSVAVTSYDTQLNFGLLGDSAAVPELEEIATWVREATEELVGLARAAA